MLNSTHVQGPLRLSDDVHYILHGLLDTLRVKRLSRRTKLGILLTPDGITLRNGLVAVEAVHVQLSLLLKVGNLQAATLSLYSAPCLLDLPVLQAGIDVVVTAAVQSATI